MESVTINKSSLTGNFFCVGGGGVLEDEPNVIFGQNKSLLWECGPFSRKKRDRMCQNVIRE